MPIYVGRKYTATQTGMRHVEVRCEKCDTEYAYDLARTGSGSEESPFLLGGQRAATSAAKQAMKHMLQRLNDEAELVPCPKCHWIPEELVAGYRRTRYRGISEAAFITAFFGTVICVICGIYAGRGNMGPLNATEWRWWFLIGPAICVGVGLMWLALQWALRQRLRPNSRFPDSPVVPLGTPPALIHDPNTGEFVIAKPEVIEDISNHWFTFQPGRVELPEVCCGCLSTTHSKYRSGAFEDAVPIPFCKACQQSLTNRLWRIGMSAIAIAILLSIGGLSLVPLSQDAFWVTVVFLTLFIPMLGWFTAEQRSELPVEFREMDLARSVYQLKFRNPDYTRVCLDHNQVQVLGDAAKSSETPNGE